MSDTVGQEAPPLPRYRVTVMEWITHDAVIEAASEQEAEAKARQMWDDNETEPFSTRDSGIDGVDVDLV